MIYMAGPLFTTAERGFNRDLVDALRGILPDEIFLPQEACAEYLTPGDIFAGCRRGLENSDLVIAILDGPDSDSGTCFEVGYASARGIPVLGVRTDFRQCGDDGGLNLMLSQSCALIYHVQSTDPALTVAGIAKDVAGYVRAIRRG